MLKLKKLIEGASQVETMSILQKEPGVLTGLGWDGVENE